MAPRAFGDARAMGYVSAGMAAYSSYTFGVKAKTAWGACAGSFGTSCARAVLYTATSAGSAAAAVQSLEFSDQFGPRRTGVPGAEDIENDLFGDDGLLDAQRLNNEIATGQVTTAALSDRGFRLNGDQLETPKGNFPTTPEGLAQAFTALGSEDGAQDYQNYKAEIKKVRAEAEKKIDEYRDYLAQLGGGPETSPNSNEIVLPTPAVLPLLAQFDNEKNKKLKNIDKAVKKKSSLKRATASDYKNSPMGLSFENIFQMVERNYKSADSRRAFFRKEYE